MPTKQISTQRQSQKNGVRKIANHQDAGPFFCPHFSDYCLDLGLLRVDDDEQNTGAG
jgi:hypothetical protein